jgi:capsular exopolysaccharide synthesis family protein
MEHTNTEPTKLAISSSRPAYDPPVAPVLLQAVEREGTELPLLEIWRILAKRKFVVFAFLALCLLAASTYSVLKRPVYEAVARVHIDPTQSTNMGLEDLMEQTLSSTDSNSRIQTQVKILESDTVALQVMQQWKLPGTLGYGMPTIKPGTNVADLSPLDREKLLKTFHRKLKVQVLPNTQLVEVHFRNPDPKLATNIANSLVDSYIERNFQSRYQATTQVSDWLSKQMEELKTRASTAQDELARFQEQHNILGADENDNIVTERLRQLNQQLTDAEADRILKEARYRLASSGNPELVAAVVPSTTLQVLRTQQAELRSQYAQLSTKFGSGYPKVPELQGQLAKLDGEIDAEVKNIGRRIEDEYQSALQAENMIRSRFDAQKQEAYALNSATTGYAILKHEVESSRDLYDSLQLKLKEAFVTAGLSSTNVSIVDRAAIPGKPVSPDVPVNLALGLFGGLLGGVALAFVWESLDDTITTSDDVEIAKLPSLGSIPWVQAKPYRPVSEMASRNGHGLFMLKRPQSNAAEAIRSLRSTLLLASFDRQPRIIVVTSGFPQEGKTTTSTNFALALAQKGARVLLVDADMRRARVHQEFDLATNRGLSTLLSGSSGPESVQKPLPELPNFSVLPAGPKPPAPAEMLASRRMQQVIQGWAAEYDHVLIDTPPVFPVTDALVLASLADTVLLVVRSGFTRKKALERMRDSLARINANVAGVVLNGVNLKLEHYYSGPYRYGYKNRYYDGYYNNEEN